MPEHPSDDLGPGAEPEQPAGNIDSEAALLQMEPDAEGLGTRHAATGFEGNAQIVMTEPGIDQMLYVDPTADFSAQASALPGRAVAGSSRVRSQLKGLGWGFWVSVGWVVLIVALAILAPLLPLQSFSEPSSSCLTTVPGAGPGAGHILGCDSASL